MAKATDYLAVVEPVVRVALAAPVVLDRDTVLPAVPANPELLEALAARWGLESSVQRLRTALEKAAM